MIPNESVKDLFRTSRRRVGWFFYLSDLSWSLQNASIWKDWQVGRTFSGQIWNKTEKVALVCDRGDWKIFSTNYDAKSVREKSFQDVPGKGLTDRAPFSGLKQDCKCGITRVYRIFSTNQNDKWLGERSFQKERFPEKIYRDLFRHHPELEISFGRQDHIVISLLLQRFGNLR